METYWVVRVEEIDRELKTIVIGEHTCKEIDLKDVLSDEELPYKSGDVVYCVKQIATLSFPRNVELFKV